MDNLRAYYSKKVKKYLKKYDLRSRVPCLPPYSPELNSDECLRNLGRRGNSYLIVLCLIVAFALSGCGIMSSISNIMGNKKDQPSEKSSQTEIVEAKKDVETPKDLNSLEEEASSEKKSSEETKSEDTKTKASSYIMPEAVYFCFDPATFKNSRVAVLLFTAPDYAPFAGFLASHSLYLRLKASGIFLDVSPEYEKIMPSSQEYLMEFARKNNYDMLITGAVTYYFDGSALQESRVDEMVKIISAHTGAATCQAYASESGVPKKEERFLRFFYDYDKNAPASPAAHLMDINAIKFLTLFSKN